jgi:hypothetical protein
MIYMERLADLLKLIDDAQIAVVGDGTKPVPAAIPVRFKAVREATPYYCEAVANLMNDGLEILDADDSKTPTQNEWDTHFSLTALKLVYEIKGWVYNTDPAEIQAAVEEIWKRENTFVMAIFQMSIAWYISDSCNYRKRYRELVEDSKARWSTLYRDAGYQLENVHGAAGYLVTLITEFNRNIGEKWKGINHAYGLNVQGKISDNDRKYSIKDSIEYVANLNSILREKCAQAKKAYNELRRDMELYQTAVYGVYNLVKEYDYEKAQSILEREGNSSFRRSAVADFTRFSEEVFRKARAELERFKKQADDCLNGVRGTFYEKISDEKRNALFTMNERESDWSQLNKCIFDSMGLNEQMADVEDWRERILDGCQYTCSDLERKQSDFRSEMHDLENEVKKIDQALLYELKFYFWDIYKENILIKDLRFEAG